MLTAIFATMLVCLLTLIVRQAGMRWNVEEARTSSKGSR